MKNTVISIFALICFFIYAPTAFAQSNIKQVCDTNVVQAQIPDSINKFINKYNKYTDSHNLTEISKIYADNYVSGDGLKKEAVINLIKDTWSSYPDIKDNSSIKDIRVKGDFATIESFDKTTGTSINKSDVTNDTGILENESHNLIYIQKFGKSWKIVSDKVIYEKTLIKFGSAKNLKVTLNAPEQVLAGETYTASLNAEVPTGMIAIASITREPIVYPETKPIEVYRQISPGADSLERLMKANTTNNNELATASVGYTELTEDILNNPEVKLTGMAIVLTRVNVIPKNEFVEQSAKLKIEPDVEQDLIQEKSEKEDLKQ